MADEAGEADEAAKTREVVGLVEAGSTLAE